MVSEPDLPDPFSCAVTLRMPSASRLKVTSMRGCARGIGGMPCISKVPRQWLSRVSGRSPSKILILTDSWLSWLVEKVLDLVTGIVEFLGMMTAMTPPDDSTPRLNGVTSINRHSEAAPEALPVRMAAWIAAP